MAGKKLFFYFILISVLALQFSCSKNRLLSETEVHRNLLENVRLGDGVPLGLSVTLRWAVEDRGVFYRQFATADTFNSQILIPRSLELVKQEANKFSSVDSVFSAERDEFIDRIKSVLKTGLVEDGIIIKDVIIADVIFPSKYIGGKEAAGLKEQELEKIRQQSIVNIEKSIAVKEQAKADGEVQIAEAEAESKVQAIKAKTEKVRRKAEIAVAETEAQLERVKAEAEADKNRSLANAEVEKIRDLKNVEVEKKRELEQIAIDKVSKLDKVEYQRQIQFARLCTDNPTYATFLVNKELASKVGIAVLPSGGERNVFDNIINQNMPGNIK
jgi:regulator of protease activity HflC (stomatin/prohibitin superfamily)